MQEKFTYCLSLFVIAVVLSTSLSAQELTPPKEKRVVVTIKGTDAKGGYVVKKIAMNGAEAEQFDVDKYIRENTKDLVNPTVKIGDTEDFHDLNKGKHEKHRIENRQIIKEVRQIDRQTDKGFLGVSEDTDRTEGVKNSGVKVIVTRLSGAAKAGLKAGDVLTQLNDAPIKTFKDVSVFMRTTKPNDKVKVTYMRDGQLKITTATLGQPQDVWKIEEAEKEACLGVYSSSYKDGTQRGAVIKDFTPVSAAREVNMQLGDVITAINGNTIKSHQEVWDEIAKYKPKESVRVAFMRKNAPQQIKATLKACKPKDDKVIVVPDMQDNAPKIDLNEKRQLVLENFAVSPNPIQDMVNIQFQAEAIPTILAFYDVSGRVLFQQTLKDFNGTYNQYFDLSSYAKGVVVVRVIQGEKAFVKQLVVN